MSNPRPLRDIVAEQAEILSALTAAISKLTALSAARPLSAAQVAEHKWESAPVSLTGKVKAPKAPKAPRTFAPAHATIRRNEPLNGIEMVFGGRIAPPVSAYVKSLGLRYSPKSALWYTKYSDVRMTDLTAAAARINAGQIS